MLKVSGSLGKSAVLSGSPTTTFKNDFAQALYNGTGLSAINKLVLVDTGGTEKDYTTSLTFNIVGDSLQVQGSIALRLATRLLR